MPLQETSGNLTTDAYGGGVAAVVPNYIEDVFSTWLYNGAGAAQSITNNIDLSTKGGLVWLKNRFNTGGTYTASHNFFDTARGMTSGSSPSLLSDTSDAQVAHSNYVIADTTGFSFGSSATGAMTNASSNSYASWTFRKQPKFFDVVTYTGNDGYYRAINHNLGSVPGCIMVKNITNSSDWWVYHRGTDASSPADYNLILNSTSAKVAPSVWGGTNPTSTQFTVNPTTYPINSSGSTYVAYLFAHNAGGFGLTGTDNVISCGSFTTDGAGSATVSLGYEPQWLMVKSTGIAQNWFVIDNMRGFSYSAALNLKPNTSGAEADFGPNVFVPTATGFVETAGLSASETYIYIAIRRGPMKVPTDATKVFKPFTYTTPSYQDTGTPIDSVLVLDAQTANVGLWGSRLVGTPPTLDPRTTNQETSGFSYAFQQGQGTSYYPSGVFGEKTNSYGWSRSPKFFDVVNWYITGSTDLRVKHNLTVTPELIIAKTRSQALDWVVYHKDIGVNGYVILNTNAAVSNASGAWGTPTATEIGVNTSGFGFTSFNYAITYLFSTTSGVSKVGSFTGTGATQTIDCGFGASGARFVLIKRTDTSGNWYSFNSSSGFTSGSSPYMVWNGAATAETTGNNGCFAASTGFTVTSTASSTVNINGGNYIFLAIA